MTSTKHVLLNAAADTFCLTRIQALQPSLGVADLSEGVLETEDPLILGHVEHLLHLWTASRKDLPVDYADHVQITSVARQPLAAVSVTVESAERALVHQTEPFDGQNLNATPLPTTHLFELLPIKTLEFPVAALKSDARVPGGEEAQTCPECGGAKGLTCRACEGGGHVACPTCQGRTEIRCPTCNGEGTRYGVSGQVVTCRQCQGDGVVRCRACQESGEVPCQICKGSGQLGCDDCQGLGFQRHFWRLYTCQKTRGATRYFSSETWPVNNGVLLPDCDPIYHDEWPWPASKGPEVPLEQSLPAPAVAWAQETMRHVLGTQEPTPPLPTAIGVPPEELKDVTPQVARADTGLRLEFRGTYIYRVNFTYCGMPGVVYIGGSRNAIFPQQVPGSEAGSIRRAWRGVLRFFTKLDSGTVGTVDQDYVTAMQCGTCHISDSLCLGPQLASRFGAKVEVTPTGYTVTLPPRKGQEASQSLQVQLELDSSQSTLLSVEIPLGEAYRDKFAKAFAMSHQLLVGRLAVITNREGREEFVLIDRRPYLHVDAGQYFVILDQLLACAREITEAGILG